MKTWPSSSLRVRGRREEGAPVGIGHEFGVDSAEWRTALDRADAFVGRLIDALPSGATLLVTADHGMVDCPPAARISIEDTAALMHGVHRVAGEPRARHVYARAGAAVDVEQAWRGELKGRAMVLTRAQVIDEGTARGAAALSKRFGSKPWASILEPAIREAEDGPLVTSYMYGFNFALWETGLLGDLRSNAEARKFYMPDGHLVGAGQHWKMPALAAAYRGGP